MTTIILGTVYGGDYPKAITLRETNKLGEKNEKEERKRI